MNAVTTPKDWYAAIYYDFVLWFRFKVYNSTIHFYLLKKRGVLALLLSFFLISVCNYVCRTPPL